MGIALLLFASCFQILEASVSRFLNPTVPQITMLSFAIMGATLAINAGISIYEYTLGKRIGSSILVADSMHTRSDIYASIGVILSFLGIRMGYAIADPLVSLLITTLIILTGIEIIKDSSTVLLDGALIEENVIRQLVKSVDGVCSSHQIRTRGTRDDIYIDLHIGVDPSLSIEEAHKVGLNVERKIKGSIKGVKDVVVHMEPKEFCESNREGEGDFQED